MAMPRRVLMVATTEPTIRNFISPIAASLRARGWNVQGMARDLSRSHESDGAFEHIWDSPWQRKPWDLRSLLAGIKHVREVAEQERFDIVHVHTPVASMVTRFALRNLRHGGRPVVVYTAHGFHFHPQGNSLSNAVYERLERTAGHWTDYLVVMNRHDFRAAERLSIVPGDHLRYMPGTGVDTARFQATHDLQAQAAAVRTNLQIPADAPAFLVVAEFIRRKRHVDVIQAFAGLATVPKAHLLLAGSGPLQPNLRQLVHELGLQDRIHFLGERRDVPTLLHAASALLLASEQEGLPRAILEAMSAGLPVIATRIRGSEDLLHPDRGLLVELGDRRALSAAMQTIVAHPEAAHAMALRASSHAHQFDQNLIVDLHEKLYLEALQ